MLKSTRQAAAVCAPMFAHRLRVRKGKFTPRCLVKLQISKAGLEEAVC